MSVKEETINKYKAILKYLGDNPDSSKAAAARELDTSPRTIDRALAWKADQPDEEESQVVEEDIVPGAGDVIVFEDDGTLDYWINAGDNYAVHEDEKGIYIVDEEADELPYEDFRDYKFSFVSRSPQPKVTNSIPEEEQAVEPEYVPEEGFPQYVLTNTGLTIIFNNGDKPEVINKTHPHFQQSVEAVIDQDWIELRRLVNIPLGIKEFSQGSIEYKDQCLYYNGFEIDNSLSKYILSALRAGDKPTALISFLEKLMGNPDSRAVNELFDFLRTASLPIVDDGCFLAYKMVSYDYKDCHSGTIDNSIGQVVSMPRSEVDPDKHNECSEGLHFCSEKYIGNYGGSRLMIVQIDPADVVAIPMDYNRSKGRTWKYKVVAEVPWEYRMTMDTHLSHLFDAMK